MIKSTHPDFELLLAGEAVRQTPELLEFLQMIDVGHEVDGRHVQLSESMESLGPSLLSQIRSRLPDPLHADLQFEIHRVVGSTNDIVLARLADPSCKGVVCMAEMQTSGKGRRGRHWVSPFGKNIYLTLGRFSRRAMAELGGLSQLVGIQVVDALRAAGVEKAGLKWPNDILLDGGKLGGILVELKPSESRGIGIVIGVGINLWLEDAHAGSIDQAWRSVSSTSVSRSDLLADITVRIIHALQKFDESGFGQFASVWDNYNCYRGEQITIIRGDEVFTGTDQGVDEFGSLRLMTSDGEQLHHSGEVSMRPVEPS